MRRLNIALVAALALLAVGARGDEVEEVEKVEEEEDFGRTVDLEMEELEEEEDVDLEHVLRGLFGNIDKDDDDADGAVVPGSNREARAKDEDGTGLEEEGGEVEEKVKGGGKKGVDLARYNNFMDTVLRRVNSYALSRFDPLTVNMNRKQSKKGGTRGGNREGNKGAGNKGKKKKKGNNSNRRRQGNRGQKGNKRNNKRGGNRNPKDLNLEEEGEGEGEEDVGVPVEDGGVERVKREVEVAEAEEVEEEEGGLEREGRDDDMEAQDEESEVGRRGVASIKRKGSNRKGNRNGNRQGGNKRGGNNRQGGKKKGGNRQGGNRQGGNRQGGNRQGGNRQGNRNGSSKKKTNKRGVNRQGGKTSAAQRASVSGIATMRRTGDVRVRNSKGGKEIRTQFVLGPVDLKMSRKYGRGKAKVTKNAKATSPELKGKMYIHVSPEGKAKVTKFFITRPSIVRVEGNLRKDTKIGNNNVMDKSLHRITPFATKKLKMAAREVLSASQPKN